MNATDKWGLKIIAPLDLMSRQEKLEVYLLLLDHIGSGLGAVSSVFTSMIVSTNLHGFLIAPSPFLLCID